MHCADDSTMHILKTPPFVDLFCLDNIFYFSFSCINSQLVDLLTCLPFSVCIQYYVCLKAERDLHFLELERLAELQLKAFGRFLTLCHVWLFFWQPSILKPGSYGNAFTPLALLLDSPSLLSSVCLSILLVHSSVVNTQSAPHLRPLTFAEPILN